MNMMTFLIYSSLTVFLVLSMAEFNSKTSVLHCVRIIVNSGKRFLFLPSVNCAPSRIHVGTYIFIGLMGQGVENSNGSFTWWIKSTFLNMCTMKSFLGMAFDDL